MTALQAKQIYGFRQGRVNAQKYAKAQARLRDNLSKGFQRKLESSLNKNARIASHQIENGNTLESSVIVGQVQEELMATIRAQVRRVFQAVYKYNDDAYNKIDQKQEGFGFQRSDQIEDALRLFFLDRESFITNMSTTQGLLIIKEVEKLYEQNLTLAVVARELRKKFRQLNKSRAAVIARTETHSAAGFANHTYHTTVSDSYGIGMVKQWIATNDLRTREAHRLASGQQVTMDEDFSVGGIPMAYAGDPKGGAKNVINCRCVVIYVDKEDDIDE